MKERDRLLASLRDTTYPNDPSLVYEAHDERFGGREQRHRRRWRDSRREESVDARPHDQREHARERVRSAP